MSPTPVKAIIVCAATAFATACGESARTATTDLSHEVDTVGTVERVRTVGTPPLWTMEEIFVVGSAGMGDTPQPDEFGRIVSVALNTDGSLFVADGSNAQISAFAPDGTFRRRLGRSGQGPGEFRAVTSIAVVEDRLLALDFRNSRVAEMRLSGEWLGTRPAPGGQSGPATMLRFYLTGADELHQWSVTSSGGRLEFIWTVHGRDGIIAEWPQLQLPAPETVFLRCPLPSSGGIRFFEVPYGSRMLQHPAGIGRTYAAWSAVPTIALITLTGDTIRIIQRPHASSPISEPEWQAATSEFVTFREDSPGVVCEPRSMPRPSGKAIFTYLMVDPANRLWVEVEIPGGRAWEIFDEQGRLVATAPGFDYYDDVPIAINGDYIAWVRLGEMDVPRVHVARIHTAP